MDYLPLFRIYMQGLYNGLSQVLNNAAEQAFVYQGVEYKSRITSRQIRMNLSDMGWTDIKGITIYTDKDLNTNDKVIYNGVQYRIESKLTYYGTTSKYEAHEVL